MKTLLYLSAFLLMASGVYAQDTKAKIDTTKWLHASLSGKSGEVSRGEIFKTPVITLDGSKLEVVEFKMSIAGKDVAYKEYEGSGSRLNSQMLAAIRNAPAHAKIYIEYIKYKGTDGKMYVARPITIELK